MLDEARGDFQGLYRWASVAAAERYAASYAMRFMTRRAVPGSVSHRITAGSDSQDFGDLAGPKEDMPNGSFHLTRGAAGYRPQWLDLRPLDKVPLDGTLEEMERLEHLDPLEAAMRIIKILYRAVAGLLALILIAANLRLYWPPSRRYGPDTLGPDVEAQLNFIDASLASGAAEEMQRLFPEGYAFSHALYGLAWVEVGMREAPGSPRHTRAVDEARAALSHLDSPRGRAAFSADLDPPYGVFYVGWSSWLRGGLLHITPPDERPLAEVARFQRDCDALARAFERSPTPYLSAYPGQAWPVDNVVAIAALRLHDTLFPPKYEHIIVGWLAEVQQRLDPATGLIPHRVDAATGAPLAGARGTSQSLLLRFLVEIDPAWAQEQYTRFRELFIAPLLGMPGTREYPHGTEGVGDVDSGPLVGGISASSTAVTLGTALVYRDRTLADPLLHTGELTGMPLRLGRTKRYLLGALPIGDAFLVWAKTARPWLVASPEVTLPPVVAWWWKAPFHAVTLVLLCAFWLVDRRIG
jgi:hypothetical protein